MLYTDRPGVLSLEQRADTPCSSRILPMIDEATGIRHGQVLAGSVSTPTKFLFSW